MVAVFDQKIDPATVLAMVNVSPAATLKLVAKDEIDSGARSAFDQAEPGPGRGLPRHHASSPRTRG